jgi:hypothetical protein
MAQITPNGSEDRLKVLQDAHRLGGHIAFKEFPGGWLLRHLSGQKIETRSCIH